MKLFSAIPIVGTLIENTVGHVIDKYISDNVAEPAVGSIVYCDLGFGHAEHSGVYVGNGEIIELNKKGHIVYVSPDEFIEGTPAINIYVSSHKSRAVGSSAVANKAIEFEKEVSVKNYNMLFDNCHMFSSACMLNDMDNASSFLWMLKDNVKKHMNGTEWLVWDSPMATYKKYQSNKSNEAQTSAAPIFTEKDLQDVEEQLKIIRSDIKETDRAISVNCKEFITHHDNHPGHGFFSSESKIERWEEKEKELELMKSNLDSQWDDILAKMKELEELEAEIKKQLNVV